MLVGCYRREVNTARKLDPLASYADLPLTEDPFLGWIAAHRAEMFEHEGRFVVIDPTVGILGVGDDPVELGRRLDPERLLMVTYVAPGFYAPFTP